MKGLLKKLENADIDVNVDVATPEEVTSMIEEAVAEQQEIATVEAEITEEVVTLEETAEAVEAVENYQRVIRKYKHVSKPVMDLMFSTGVGSAVEYFSSRSLPATESLSEFSDNQKETQIVLASLEEAKEGLVKRAIKAVGAFFNRIKEWFSKKYEQFKKRRAAVKAVKEMVNKVSDDVFKEISGLSHDLETAMTVSAFKQVAKQYSDFYSAFIEIARGKGIFGYKETARDIIKKSEDLHSNKDIMGVYKQMASDNPTWGDLGFKSKSVAAGAINDYDGFCAGLEKLDASFKSAESKVMASINKDVEKGKEGASAELSDVTEYIATVTSLRTKHLNIIQTSFGSEILNLRTALSQAGKKEDKGEDK